MSKLYETKTMKSNGALHHFFRESGSSSWIYHNWDGPAIEPIEGEETNLKKTYYLYGRQMEYADWSMSRKDREGLPWYKNPSMRGTTRF